MSSVLRHRYDNRLLRKFSLTAEIMGFQYLVDVAWTMPRDSRMITRRLAPILIAFASAVGAVVSAPVVIAAIQPKAAENVELLRALPAR